jgi:tRNA threonylcarbamoyladenosine biosynthesis protein TsaE
MYIADENAMFTLGQSLASRMRADDLVAIDGPLGAGKTVLCRGILRGLGHIGDVSSPTYNIVQHYDAPELTFPICHVDLYRINDPSEIEELGLHDNDALHLVEWAERDPTLAARARIAIRIAVSDEGGREVDVVEHN